MYIVFDTETNGLPKSYNAPITSVLNWPRVVQLAWKLYDENGVHLETHNYIIKPDNFIITDESIKIHRITNERANKEGVSLEFAIDKFEENVKRSNYLIAHNISFDEKVVGCELHRLGKKNFLYDCVHVDTMKSTVDFCAVPAKRGGGYKFPKLSELYFKLFNEYFADAHDALVDVSALAKCFFELQKIGFYGYKKTKQDTNSTIFDSIIENGQEQEIDYKPLVNLSVHSFHSILEGAGSVVEYVKKAKTYNQPALAITDISTMSGTFEFYQKCKSNGIKPIIGIEFYVNDKIGIIDNGRAQGDSYKLRAYAKNKTGFKNLCHLLYLANTKGFHGTGRISSEWLFQYSEGVVVTTSSLEGNIAKLLQKGKDQEAEKYFSSLVEKFGVDNVYAEIQLSSFAQQKTHNSFMISLADKYKTRVVITNNTFFCEKDGCEIQNVVTAIKQKTSIDDARLKENNEEMYFYSSKDYEFMNKKNGYDYPVKFLDYCYKNTLDLAEKCTYDFEIGAEKYPKYEPTQDVIEYFKTDNVQEIAYKLAFAKLNQKFKILAKNGLIKDDQETRDKYFNRLQYELDVIKSKNMLDYFLVNWEILRDYRKKGYDTGPARGCFLPESLVKMADNTKKKIKDISIGEMVYDAFGVEQVVDDVLIYDIDEEIVELEMEDGRILSMTKDHRVLTKNRDWVEAQYLTEEDEISEIF